MSRPLDIFAETGRQSNRKPWAEPFYYAPLRGIRLPMRLDPTNRNRVQVKSLLDPGWLETFFSCPVRMYKYQKYKAGICPQRRNHGPAQVPLAEIYNVSSWRARTA